MPAIPTKQARLFFERVSEKKRRAYGLTRLPCGARPAFKVQPDENANRTVPGVRDSPSITSPVLTQNNREVGLSLPCLGHWQNPTQHAELINGVSLTSIQGIVGNVRNEQMSRTDRVCDQKGIIRTPGTLAFKVGIWEKQDSMR